MSDITHPARGTAAGILLAALTSALLIPVARADDLPRTPANPTYQRECGDCHVAYPPALLTADGWRQVMGQLDRHYGVDASIDAATAASIGAWLDRHGATRGKFAAPERGDAQTNVRSSTATTAQPPRLTDTAWFRHEHDEAPASARRNAGSMARCDACHRDAAKGDYSEHSIRFPQKAQGGQS